MKLDCRQYGMVPFWFWNGDQNEKEISRQLELARQGGLRGMAIHGRKGNSIEYMSDRWISLVRHACVKARELDLEIWLYDEDGCPSGTVGQRLPLRGEKYQQKALRFAYVTAKEAANDALIVKAFAASDFKRAVNPAELPENAKVLAFSKYFITDYIDALNRDVLDEFLNMTHQVYAEKLQEFFGDPITGIYTDDLNHLLIYGDDVPYLSYTDSLEETFREKCGYSILDNLPSLVENLPECEKVRFDYRHTVMRMFLDNYVEPMRQWCKQHGLPLTGHLSGDEGSMLISICRFSSAMPFYEHEDIPGIDDFLTAREDSNYLRHAFNDLGFSMIILCKQVSSVANQLKDGLCSSEVLTSRGWGIPVQQQMVQLRFQQGLGINILVPHDFSYSTKGIAKRDHPASYFFQQPWYKENKELHDAVSRTSQLLSRGVCAAKTAILHPVTSGWLALDGERLTKSFKCQYPGILPDTKSLEKELGELSLFLLQKHIDFEYADEEILSRHGKVLNGKLIIGQTEYENILLPSLINIQRTTLELLKEFSINGGKIIQMGEPAGLIDGINADDIYKFETISLDSFEALATEIAPLLEFTVENGNAEDVLLHSRLVDGKLEYYLLNCSDIPLCLSVKSAPDNYILYDPQDDSVINDNKSFPARFMLQPSACCHILPENLIDSATTDIFETIFSPLLKGACDFLPIALDIKVEPENENILMLDYGFTTQGERILFSESKNLPAGTTIIIPVNIPETDKIFNLYAETPEAFNIKLNGNELTWDKNCTHPASQELHKASLQGLIRTGHNEISLTTSGTRLEMLYLSGAFAVQLHDDPAGCYADIADMSLELGDASQQGLPFYWGNLKYYLQFNLDKIPERCWLDLGQVDGVIRITVNNKNGGFCYKNPYLLNLNGLLRQGNNCIEVKLYNTAHNFFGPNRAESIFGPDRVWEGCSVTAWTPQIDRQYSDSWGIAPFGIYGPVKLLSVSKEE